MIPDGTPGARVLTTLLFEMRRRDVRKGIATLCVGGGMGVAMCVERQQSNREPRDTGERSFGVAVH